jgi:hypothetical protein
MIEWEASDSHTSNIYIDKTLHNIGTQRYMGIYSCDTIPQHIAALKHFSIICNLDKFGEHGSHFITIVGQPTRILYIDPLGQPCNNQFIAKFLQDAQQQSNRKLEWQTVAIQHPLSTFCGYYCMLMVLYHERRHHGIRLNFNIHNTLLNDRQCIQYINQFIKLSS